jgi:hypothetical protein
MPVKPNLFKRGLAEEQTQFGLWLGLAGRYMDALIETPRTKTDGYT